METAVVELTKEQRHEVYKLALSFLQEERARFESGNRACQRGLCWVLKMGMLAAHLEERGPSPYSNPEAFTEVFEYCPDKENPSDHWFKPGDFVPRIEILEACIKETQP